MILVLSQDFRLAQRWARSQNLNMAQWRYVTHPHDLRGWSPPSKVVVVGHMPKWVLLSADANMALDISDMAIEYVDYP